MLAWDLETDGLLPELTRIHCAWTYDTNTGTYKGYRPETVHQLWKDLDADPEGIAGHNTLGFDLEALRKVYGTEPGFQAFYEKCHKGVGSWFVDTLILSRLLFPDISAMDWAAYNSGRLSKEFPDTPAARKKLFGNHNLQAWGYRLGVLKGSLGDDSGETDWSTFTEEMYEYNKQDVKVTATLLDFQERRASGLTNLQCIELEHKFALYLDHQMRAGVCFDVRTADKMVTEWKSELSDKVAEMRAKVPDIVITEDFTPKRANRTKGWEAGKTIQRTSVVRFNPRSAPHVIFFLQEKYGWVPTEFGKTKSAKYPQGQPKVTHEVLDALTYPEAPLLSRIRLLMDRIALVESSPSSWKKNLKSDGRIHGRIIHNGTPTSRCRHASPNLGNIPSPKAEYGAALRALFHPQPGWDLMGLDADSLEGRLLAHYLYPYDNGAFFQAAFMGSKADGTDNHSRTRDAINRELREAGQEKLARIDRETAKTIYYAILYGCWPKKVAQIIMKLLKVEIPAQRQYAIGTLITNALKESIPGLSELISDLEKTYEEEQQSGKYPHMFMPDGRPTPCRSSHSLLNTACQTLGAVLVKVATVRFWEKMEEAGLRIGVDWNPLLHVHDELQVEIRRGEIKGVPIRDLARRFAAEAVAEAGEILGLRVPFVGNADIGSNWGETH